MATFSTFEKRLKYQCKPIQRAFKRIWRVFKWLVSDFKKVEKVPKIEQKVKGLINLLQEH